MRLFQRGGFWWLDATLQDKRRVRKSTGIAVSDERARRKASEEAERMLTDGGESTAYTLRQALQHSYDTNWRNKRSARSMEHMIGVLSRQVGHHDVKNAAYGIFKDYGDALIREGYAPATVNRRMTAIGVALREQVRRGVLKSRPELPHWSEKNVRERYISHEEEDALLQYFRRQHAASRELGDHAAMAEWTYMHAMLVFLVDTGFRFGEAFKFDVQSGHADLKHGETKTGDGRRVPLTDRANVAAGTLLADPRHAQFAALLAATPHHKAPWDWVAYRLQRALKETGIAGVSLHTLRHTCASRLVQRGVPIFTVSRWLGHASVVTTQRYAKLAPDSLSNALAALQGAPVAVQPRAAHDQSPGIAVGRK